TDDEEMPANPLRTSLQDTITSLYSQCYLASRIRLPRPAESQLHHTLYIVKIERPDLFRERLWVSPYTFDRLIKTLEDDVIFQNHSELEPQASVKEQVAVTLFVLGHDSNGASQQLAHVRYPSKKEKDAAQDWVEKHSWHEGWCFVDGTLVPLAFCPFWYG
ncbi:hypothetical protein CYLTODRAFT_327375, partial [Cylindrobasidium torrendii FP15055 ss-10]